MVDWRWSSCAVVWIFWMLSGSGIAFAAESLGTFRWQLAPFCNVLTLAFVADGPIATVSGYDDGCGAGQRQATVGSAFPNPNGTIGIGLTILNPTGLPGSIQALLSAGAPSGTWQDQAGNAGAFLFDPAASPSGSPRPLAGCPPDSVRAGPTCIDKYEASVWYVPSVLTTLIERIRQGTVTAGNFGEDWVPAPVQLGLQAGDLAAFGCSVTGNDTGCKDIYAVSIPGVLPARVISWFQSAATARNAGKRLPTNAEWQAAALGTPGPPSCNTQGLPGPTTTGSFPACVSFVGAFDMVGNVWEWVADWVPRSTACGDWGVFGGGFDRQCLAGAATDGAPGALVRGAHYATEFFPASTGVFDVDGFQPPSSANFVTGFRAAR